jgi:hypothetical protein
MPLPIIMCHKDATRKELWINTSSVRSMLPEFNIKEFSRLKSLRSIQDPSMRPAEISISGSPRNALQKMSKCILAKRSTFSEANSEKSMSKSREI